MTPLRRMKMFATSMLAVALVVFVVARHFEPAHDWVGYVRAFSEAAMVGALADWFAVTALFRHPLGLPIPHTAIIPKRKHEIGRGLGEFVQGNFLTPEVLVPKVRAAQVASRLATWLSGEDAAERVVATVADGARNALQGVNDAEMTTLVGERLRSTLEGTTVAPIVGKGLETLSGEGRKDHAFDVVIAKAHATLLDNRDRLRSQFERESPWWLPERVDAKVFDRLFLGFGRVLTDMHADRFHPLRTALVERADRFVHDLQHDPVTIAKGEELKQRLLTNATVDHWASQAWVAMRAEIVHQLEDTNSAGRTRSRHALAVYAQRVHTDDALRAQIDERIERFVVAAIVRSGNEVADLIAGTVARWEAADTVDRIENQIGRDLQFIRINGTLVGGLAGTLIHVVTHL
jgi:uncharacterized membrane-anchored protein YjiN (DUF445 family)